MKPTNCLLKKKFSVFLLFLIFGNPSVYAQLENNIFKIHNEIQLADTQQLKLRFDNLNYFRNNEYFGNIQEGYTLFGYQLQPELVYFPNANVRVAGGIFLMKDFGNPAYTQISPTFNIKLKKNDVSLLFGNLEANLNHRLVEPLYDFERLIYDKLEHGIQLKIEKPRLWLDAWMDWEKMIYHGSPFQEQFTAGFSSDINLLGAEKKLALSIPVQTMVSHKGGQIQLGGDSLGLHNVLTQWNSAVGFSISYKFDNSFLKEIKTDNYFVYYKDLSGTQTVAYREGTGAYLNLLVKTKFIDVMLNYWNASSYIAPRGGPLYQSVSFDDPSYTEKNRELLFLRLMYEKEFFKDLFFNVRFEPYQDFVEKRLEYSYSIYLTYRKDIKLAKF